MGRWWTGYTSITGDKACIPPSHGALWRLALPCYCSSSQSYGLFAAKIPSEKMRLITASGVRNVNFYMFSRQEPYRELGANYFDQRRRHYTVDRLARRIEHL